MRRIASGSTTCRWSSSSAGCWRTPSPTWGSTNGCGRSSRTSASTTARSSPTNRMPHSATAAWAVSPPASSTPCRPWASRRTATAFATRTGCSASPSRTAGRSRRPRSGCARPTRGSSNATGGQLPNPLRRVRAHRWCPHHLDAGGDRAGRRLRHAGSRLARALGQHAAPVVREIGAGIRPGALQPGRLDGRRRPLGPRRNHQPRALPRRHHRAGPGAEAEAGVLLHRRLARRHPAAVPGAP